MVLQKLLLISVALMLLAGCSRSGSGASSASSTSPSPSPGGGAFVPATNYPFEVIVSSQYESGGSSTVEADCQMPVGSPAGTVLQCTNATGAAQNVVAIPEGRLYFSNLTFTVNVGSSSVANNCALVYFTPFSYRASTSATFLPPWLGVGAKAIDCSGASTAPTADCYGGVGKDIVTNFPNYRSMYSMVSSSSTVSYTAKSANSHSYGSNRWATNNYAAPGVTHTWKNGDSYVGNTALNYVFQCVDQYLQPVYEYDLVIDDVDITGVYPNTTQGNSSINQRPDWEATSWDY